MEVDDMPDDRMLHRCQGHSAKLAEIDHLTFRVWTQYLLSADDFGVMPDSAALIRGSNFALGRESEDEIARCLGVIVSLSLVERFTHQGQPFLCSLEWQDYQKIAYPRTSYYPDPPVLILAKCSPKTRGLFKKKKKAKAGDGHRLTANGLRLTANGKEEPSPEGAKATPEDLLGFWVEAAGGTDFTQSSVLTSALRRTAHARLKEQADPKWWVAYFGRITASDFMCGRTARAVGHESWRPTFAWVLAPANMAKVLAGNYDNRQAVSDRDRFGWWQDCQHEPRCETAPMHTQRLALDAARKTREEP